MQLKSGALCHEQVSPYVNRLLEGAGVILFLEIAFISELVVGAVLFF